MKNLPDNTTIAALATAPGGAIAVIRLSGPRSIEIVEGLFSRPLANQPGHTTLFGTIRHRGGIIDEVLVTLFRAPRSYTGEEMVEISCHGSSFIVREILSLLFDRGAVQAPAGEFTKRAFLNGKLDLSQAEAVADLIASEHQAAHQVAMLQMRGGYSEKLASLRSHLLQIASLLELELDFAEEDVEFANRQQLHQFLHTAHEHCRRLAESFRLGNVLKNGIPVAIVGKPNVGKSTLLNRLLNEERAIVSEVAGTTRDFIEERVTLGGVSFRFIDTAGLRETSDRIEQLGIERTRERMARASIVLLMVGEPASVEQVEAQIDELALSPDQQVWVLLNKEDQWDTAPLHRALTQQGIVSLSFSARSERGVEELVDALIDTVEFDPACETLVVTNARHYDALCASIRAFERAKAGLANDISIDLVSEDVRQVLHHLGTITGEITTQEILESIFQKFCIGK